MEWNEPGLVLSLRPHGENDLILAVLTPTHGRHLGLYRGGRGPRRRAGLEIGAQVAAGWRARLEAHLGHWTLEPLANPAARLFDDPPRLTLLGAACAMADLCLPERLPVPGACESLAGLIDALTLGADATAYVAWELGLLAGLGYGLDLSECAVSGTRADLVYVSPKSGRAVSRTAGADWAEKLLPLPAFLTGGPRAPGDITAALRLSGYFFERHVLEGRALPAGRGRIGGGVGL